MKKFLSLVMALIMVMSLVTVASAADYTDAADVDKTEAVDVMSAVGVFQGSAGKFNPKAILNRAEAAKLIAYLDLGEKTAEALPAVQSFSDVPATHWAAKYIAYCADAGYINGVGNGKFDPTGKLTGYQFGKLVLCVLGYDATIESFVGANWSIAVAKLMKSNDINKGVKAAPSAELTREDAAQYCLNALKATTVDYESKGTNVTINGVVIATGASKAEAVYDTIAAGATAIKTGTAKDNKYTVELGEKLYEGDLALNDDDVTAFGAPAITWTMAGYGDDGKIGSYTNAATLTYTDKVKAGDIYTALGKPAQSDIDTFAYYIDGKDDAGANLVKANIASGNTTEIGGKGAVTTVYYDKDADDMVVTTVNTYFGTISNYTAAVLDKNGDVVTKSFVKVASNASAKPGTLKDAGKINSTKFTKNDQYEATPVLYTAAWNGTNYTVKSVAKADNTKTLTATVAGNSGFTADGTKYSYSAKVAAKVGAGDVSGKQSKTVYFDDYGYAIYVENATAANNYAVVVAYKTISGMTDEASYYEARLLKFDGTTEVVKSKTANVNTMVDNIVTYSEDADDAAYTVLNAVGTATGGTVAVTKNTPAVGGATTDNNTVFVISETSAGKTTYKVFTGINNVASVTSCAAWAHYDLTTDGDTVADYVYVKNAVYAGGSSTDVIYYYKNASNPTTSVDNGTYYELKAIVNGEMNETIKASNVSLAQRFSGSLTTNSKGVITSAADLAGGSGDSTKTTHYDVAVTSDAKSGVVGLGGTAYSYTDDTAVYFWDISDGEFTEATTADLVTGEGYTVDFYTTGAADRAITMAVIVKA